MITQAQVNNLNHKIGSDIYALNEGLLVANKLSKRTIKNNLLDDLTDGKKLTPRALSMAMEILGLNLITMAQNKI